LSDNYEKWLSSYYRWNGIMSNDVLRAGRPRVRIPAEARDVSLFQKSIPALGPTQHHIQWEPGSFQGDAVAVREAVYSSPYIAEVKNECSYISTPPPPHMPSWHWQGQLHLSSTEVRRIDFSLNNTDRINADVGKNIRLTWIKIMLRLRRDKSVVGEFPSARCNMCVVTSVLQIVSVTPLNSPNLPLQSIPLSLYGCTFFCFVCDCPQMFALLLQITFINSQQVRALSK